MPSANPAMNTRNALVYCGCVCPKLCLGETSIGDFGVGLVFWNGGGIPVGQSGCWIADWFDNGIQSMLNDGWMNHLHHQYNRVDTNTFIPLNIPSSRQIIGSQDFNPMLNAITVSPRRGGTFPLAQTAGWRGQRPPEEPPRALKPLPRRRANCARPVSPRHNYDPRQSGYEHSRNG